MRGATDCYIRFITNIIDNFNSHAPCGAQLALCKKSKNLLSSISTHTPHAGRNFICMPFFAVTVYFNSHAPCGAQQLAVYISCRRFCIISTHTPHAGRNADSNILTSLEVDFNSHAPCGAQPGFRAGKDLYIKFQLTRPMRGATG